MNVRVGRWFVLGCALFACVGLDASRAEESSSPVQYDAQGRLIFPSDYRSWPLIGTGLDMAYGPLRARSGGRPPFTNVFVNPEAYRTFLKTGAWPDRTLFVLEVRRSIAVNNAANGNNGRYQGDIVGIEAEVKDTQRFAGGWAFFDLDVDERAGEQIDSDASCYSCHAQNAAVENTFVQFYPVLREVAKQHGTFKSVPEAF